MPSPQVTGLTKQYLQKGYLIIIISGMSKIVGYMVTWTTYGGWLPDDERGYVENGSIRHGNIKILKRNMDRQKSATVGLDLQEKEIIRQTILAES